MCNTTHCCNSNPNPSKECKELANRAIRLNIEAKCLSEKAEEEAKEARILEKEAAKFLESSEKELAESRSLFNKSSQLFEKSQCLAHKAALCQCKAMKCFANCPSPSLNECKDLRCESERLYAESKEINCIATKISHKAFQEQAEAIVFADKSKDFMLKASHQWKACQRLIKESESLFQRARILGEKAMCCFAHTCNTNCLKYENFYSTNGNENSNCHYTDNDNNTNDCYCNYSNDFNNDFNNDFTTDTSNCTPCYR